MFVVSKYRHETILKEKEEKHKQQLKHKEEQCRHFLRNKDNTISDLKKEIEKLEKINKDLQSKVNVSIIAKQQLKALCICKLDKKNFMYTLDLTPVNISVSGRKVYEIAQLLG